jgi:hypothetical protein
MIRAFAAASVLALAGCGATMQTKFVEAPKTRMPENIRAACDPVPAPPDHGSSMGDLYSYTGSLIGLYSECAARNALKLDWAASQGQ